jgi:hypothetical protein
MKEKLSVEKLKEMKPHTIFATGELLSRKWVAIRGETYDWAVYYGDIYDNPNAIALLGDKIHDRELIEFLVPCEPEALLMYRN